MKDMFAQGGSGSAGIKTNKQAIARACNVKVSEVIYSNDTITTLDGKKVIYDKPNQYIWGLPSGIPSGATVVSVTGSTLIYSPGNISIELEPVPGTAQELENELQSNNGEDKIGTTHRGSLAQDLDAIDRRPDGYNNSIVNVLSNGLDVTVDKDITLDALLTLSNNQVIDYAGGKITNTFKGGAVYGNGVTGIRLNGLRLSGLIENDVTTGGNVGYAVNFDNSSNLRISDINTEKYTGSILLTNCTDSVIRDVYSRANRYHSNAVAGAYGVILQGGQRILIDGINFEADASKGDLGRHSVYISVNQADLTQYCQDITVRGVISRKSGLNNRGMWDMVIRRSNNVLITDFDCQGSNGGISINAENGPVDNVHITNGTLLIRQYDDNAVYAIDLSGGTAGMNNLVGALVDNVTIKMEYDTATVTNQRMVAFNVLARNSRISNIIIRTPGPSTPILVNGGMYLQFSGISDFVTEDGTGLNYLIRFTAATNNVSIENIQTRRPMFAGLEFVTNMTVDFPRKAGITNSAGTLTTVDTNTLISNVTFSGANVVITFNPHVTQDAIDNLRLEVTSANTAAVITSRASKTLTVRITDLAGTVIGTSGSYSFNVHLTS